MRQHSDIHGESGLDGSPAFQALVPPVEAETGVPAVVRMAEVIGAQTEGVTLVATGALTNVALLLTLYPELAGNQIRRIVFMVCPLFFVLGRLLGAT